MFWNYFCKRLAYFEYYIIKPFPGKWWVSSDNPVILNNHVNEDSLISLDTEIVFPFSPEFVIILKMSKSKRVSQIFENTVLKKATVASCDITDEINEIISDNAEKFVIILKWMVCIHFNNKIANKLALVLSLKFNKIFLVLESLSCQIKNMFKLQRFTQQNL